MTADPSTFEHDNENIYAGYAQYNTSFRRFRCFGRCSLRATTDGTYRANTITTDALGNDTITPNIVGHTYNNIFPDVSVKYQATRRSADPRRLLDGHRPPGIQPDHGRPDGQSAKRHSRGHPGQSRI